jgi:transposase
MGGVRSKVVFRKAQPLLLQEDPLSRLGEDSPAVWLKQTLSRLDLSGVRALFEEKGGIPYDPSRLLGILLLGSFVNKTSSRELEEACRFDVRFMYVADDETPDYRTIARFRNRIASEMEDLFAQVVRLAMEDGLVRLGRIAIDSTKIASAGSQAKKWMTSAASEDAEDGFFLEYSDPDARVRTTRKGTLRGYTIQAGVDTETGIVVAVDVNLDAADRSAALPMVEKIAGVTGFLPDAVLADTGYDSNQTYNELENKGITAYIPPENKPGIFWSEDESGVLRCPMGNPTKAGKPKMDKGRLVIAHHVQGCRRCAFKSTCCPESRSRSLVCESALSPLPRIRAGKLAMTPEGKAAVFERAGSIEPVFGDMKWNRGFTRLTMRGETKVKGEVLLGFMAKNLKRMFKEALKAIQELIFLFYGSSSTQTFQLHAA